MDIEKFIIDGVENAVKTSFSTEKIEERYEKHRAKLHFLPVDLRVYQGGIQSLNIKLGDILVKISNRIIDENPNLELHELSGKKIKKINSTETSTEINNFIRLHNNKNTASKQEFDELITNISITEPSSLRPRTQNVDVDLLFTKKDEDKIYFFESKAVDDHDTGKFNDLNRKVFETYGALLNALDSDERSKLVPNLMYFSEAKRYEPIYIPKENQFRGKEFFKKFLDYDVKDLEPILIKAGDLMMNYLHEQYEEIVTLGKYHT